MKCIVSKAEFADHWIVHDPSIPWNFYPYSTREAAEAYARRRNDNAETNLDRFINYADARLAEAWHNREQK